MVFIVCNSQFRGDREVSQFYNPPLFTLFSIRDEPYVLYLAAVGHVPSSSRPVASSDLDCLYASFRLITTTSY